jgi:hypothetical protein
VEERRNSCNKDEKTEHRLKRLGPNRVQENAEVDQDEKDG